MSQPPRNKELIQLAESRALIADLFAPNPWIYWCDFLFHIILSWGLFAVAVSLPNYSIFQALALIVAALGFYRSSIFIHEIAHLKRSSFKVFRIVWNVICGFALFVPSYGYIGVHLDHHRRNVYGKAEDGEYLPFVAQGRTGIISFLLIALLLPVVFFVRAFFLTFLSFFSKRVRDWSWEHLSSLAIDFEYSRPPAPPRDAPWFRLQEVMTFIYATTFLALFYFEVLPLKVLVLWYVAAALVFFLNALRTLVAHRYTNAGDKEMSLTEQYLDSVDIKGNFLTGLWAPVGLRYHATHHLFPNLPYHNLAKARQRLEEKLPDNKTYNQALNKSLWEAFRQLWEASGRDSETKRHAIAHSESR